MKFKLLSVSDIAGTNNVTINIGDYIQALAASQFYPQIDGFIDRDDELNSYDGEECKVIMNGWYMHCPQNWPPSAKIIPLFIAVHINSTAKDTMLSPAGINYLKKYGPIGCRDLRTEELLKREGINAYFSGCLTLTLGKKYYSAEKNGPTYIVDPIMNSITNLPNIVRALFVFFLHPSDVLHLLKTKGLNIHSGRNFIMRFVKTALYYREYKKVFGRDLIMTSVYLTHDKGDYYQVSFRTNQERLKEAERLVKMYAKAKFVLTSRIHCALPCLGVGTPVVFIESKQNGEESKCRMDGLRELFNVAIIDNGRLTPSSQIINTDYVNAPPANKSNWITLAKEMDEKCSSFISGPESEVFSTSGVIIPG